MSAVLSIASPAALPHARLRIDLAWALAGGALLLAWDASGFDRQVMRLVGTSQGFTWRDAWLTATLAHEGGRMLAWATFALLLLFTLRPQWLPGPRHAERWRALGATLACLVVVPGLKRVSSTSCPWDLEEFGGKAQYVSHWAFGITDGGGGHCFPSGHAVAAFAFFSVYFLMRRHQPGFARAWLAGVLVVGALFGTAQLLRGAHYPSHTLWSAWLCWITCVLVAQWPRLRSMLQPTASPTSPA